MKNLLKLTVGAVALITVVLLTNGQSASTQPIKFETEIPQRLDVRSRLFKTQNVFNSLLLDTRTGRILQVQFSQEPDKLGWSALNDKSLVEDEKNAKDGRFTLYATMNIFNFILLDQESGRMWQCQYSLEKEKRFIQSINESSK
jgi:hypothetical protein